MLELLDQKRVDLTQRLPFEVVLEKDVNLVNRLVELYLAGLNQTKTTFKDLLLESALLVLKHQHQIGTGPEIGWDSEIAVGRFRKYLSLWLRS